jgi:hypothetical protein
VVVGAVFGDVVVVVGAVVVVVVAGTQPPIEDTMPIEATLES